MNWFEFLISTFIFLAFVMFIFLIFTNKFSSNINDIKTRELNKVIEYLNNLLMSRGTPEKWEKIDQKPLSVGILDKIYFIPIIIDGRENNRTYEIVSLKLNVDEKCEKYVSDKSFRVFDDFLNEINFTSFNKNYCQNGGVRNTSVVFFDHFNSTKKYYFYYSSQDLNQKNYTMYSGLLAYWDFDSTENIAEDRTQYQNNGLAYNPIIVDGIFNYALNFSSGSFVNVSKNNLNSSKISIDLWVYIYDTADSVVVEKYNSYGIKIVDGKLFGYVFDLPNNMQPSYVLQENKWYHLNFISDGLSHKLYLNGVLSNSTEYAANIPTIEGPLSIGADYNGNNNFHGILDEIRVYNYTLNDEEILASNSSAPIKIRKFPTTEKEFIFFEKLESAKNLTLEELEKIFGNDHKFYVEVYKK